MLARLSLGSRPVSFAVVHLDSHGTREERARELAVLLDAIDASDAGAPALIGGDLNAFSLTLAEIGDAGRVAEALRDDPGRWADPTPHEPLFALAAERGYGWEPCNAACVPTLRHATASGSAPSSSTGSWRAGSPARRRA